MFSTNVDSIRNFTKTFTISKQITKIIYSFIEINQNYQKLYSDEK